MRERISNEVRVVHMIGKTFGVGWWHKFFFFFLTGKPFGRLCLRQSFRIETMMGQKVWTLVCQTAKVMCSAACFCFDSKLHPGSGAMVYALISVLLLSLDD